MRKPYDVVIIGCGPAGERAAIQAARAELRVAVIERHHVVGGTAVNWGTIPSKTLRESALFIHSLTRQKLEGFAYQLADQITIGDFMFRERQVVQRELELINRSLERYPIEVFEGEGRFIDPHTVAVFDRDGEVSRELEGDVILVATGSTPNRPPEVPFDGARVFDSDTILQLPRMPRSMLVLGAGVIGVEYASIFAALGLEVTLVDTRDRLLPYLDREIVQVLEGELRRMGIRILHDHRHESISRGPGGAEHVFVRTRGGLDLKADVLLYCVGRDGNTRRLGLEAVGLRPDSRGLLQVDENLQTAVPHIYAVGDVIGYPALANTSMDQGRRAIRHAFGISGPAGKTEALPFAVYTIPEVSFIGESEESLRERGVGYVVGRGAYAKNPRGQILGEHGGMLKLLFERESGILVGVYIVGRGASELIHIGQAFLRQRSTAEQIAETLFNYPTLSDLYRHAALVALRDLEP